MITGDEDGSFQSTLRRLVVAPASPCFNVSRRAFTRFPHPVSLLVKFIARCLTHRFVKWKYFSGETAAGGRFCNKRGNSNKSTDSGNPRIERR